MGYVTREMIDRAKEMDLLTYLQTYEPQELVHFGGSTYCTREHDSLKISNGKWCWFSRGIGGRTALDYLIKVKEVPFTDAVERIVGRAAERPPISYPRQQPERTKTLLLPQASRCATHAVEYLHSRGIDYELIDFCIRSGRLYESYPHHNVVFVGKDNDGQPRYACLRGIGTDFKGEATGSDKRFSFSIPAEEPSTVLYLFESAIPAFFCDDGAGGQAAVEGAAPVVSGRCVPAQEELDGAASAAGSVSVSSGPPGNPNHLPVSRQRPCGPQRRRCDPAAAGR